jgi:hypothetical protein
MWEFTGKRISKGRLCVTDGDVVCGDLITYANGDRAIIPHSNQFTEYGHECNQMAKRCLVALDSIELVQIKDPFTVDATHTDKGEIATAEALKYRQRARAAKEAAKCNAVMTKALEWIYGNPGKGNVNEVANEALKRVKVIQSNT